MWWYAPLCTRLSMRIYTNIQKYTLIRIYVWYPSYEYDNSGICVFRLLYTHDSCYFTWFVLRFFVFYFYFHMLYYRPPLWSSGQSSWLLIRRPGFDSRHYQKKKVMGLERGPLSLVSTTEELLDRKVADPV
jgi:hypothetical protein